MIIEKNKHITEELERLQKLRTLVACEKKLAEHNDEPDGMTITDLEEWLKEIDNEIAKIRFKKPTIARLLNKCLD
jgi:hypothetical protein